MQLQIRESARIQEDAIQVAIKKARNNCLSCAEGYLDLASHHGASEKVIQDALERAANAQGQHMSRRDLIKLLAASSVALGAATMLNHEAFAASADQFGHYYGTDSNTQSRFGMQQDFYIGRMGQALTADSPYYAFNTTAALRAGYNSTYGYWAVHGPTSNLRPTALSDAQWGQQQADAAYAAWIGANLVGGLTIFAQVEPETLGWEQYNYSANLGTLNGFLDELSAISSESPGLYITPSNWNTLLGGDYKDPSDSNHQTMNPDITLNTPFVLSVASYHVCDSGLCAPCDPGCATTQPTVRSLFDSTVQNITLGGFHPVIWQYWISIPKDNLCGRCPHDDGNNDYDVTTQDPSTRSFQPNPMPA